MEEDRAPDEVSRQSSPQAVTRDEKPFVRIGWSQGKSPYTDPSFSHSRCHYGVEQAIKSSCNFGVRSVEILRQKWYTTSGDCDLFVATAADRERLIYNSTSWLPSVDNAQFARVKIRNPPSERPSSPYRPPSIHHVSYFRITWVCSDGPYKSTDSKHVLLMLRDNLSVHSDSTLAAVVVNDLEIHPYCGDMIVHASEADVKLLISKSQLWAEALIRSDEIELQDKTGCIERTSKHRDPPPESTTPISFRIRWNMPDPPYKEFDWRNFSHRLILDMLNTALKASGSPSLAAVHFEIVDPKWVSGDVDVYTTHRDRERAVKYAHLWFPHLIHGEFARIPKEYYPKPQIEAPVAQESMESTPLPSGHTPSEELRRKSNGSKRNLEDISVNSQSNLLRQQSRRDKRKRKKIRKQLRKQEEQENQAPVMTGLAYHVSY
jgi:hypothetical protein